MSGNNQYLRRALVGIVLTLAAVSTSYATEWYVASPREQKCVPASVAFPAIGRNPAAQTPGDAAQFSKRGGFDASVTYLSPTRAELKISMGQDPVTWAMFASASDCSGFLKFLAKGTPAPPPPPTQERAFGIYQGKTSGVEVGVETKPEGTGLVIRNQTNAVLRIDPRGLKLVTRNSSVSPCTIHMLNLMGLGSPLVTVEVGAGKTEGFFLGACPSTGNNGVMNSPLIVREVIRKVVVGDLDIPVKLDR